MPVLIKNPELILTSKPIGHELVSVIVEAPVKGRGLQIAKVRRQDDPEFFDLLFAIHRMPYEETSGAFNALPEPVKIRLETMGVFIRAEEVAPKVLYGCVLEGDPAADADDVPGDLIVNPGFHYRPDEELPETLRHRVRFSERFLRGYSIGWVEEPEDGIIFPYWIPGTLRHFAAALKPGEPVPALPGGAPRLFREARVFVCREELAHRRASRLAQWRDAWREFALQRHAALDSLIPPPHLAALRVYFCEMMESGRVRLGDHDSPLRYNAHNDELLFFFHHQLAGLASRIAGRPLKASHNHFISYLPGAILRPHVDPIEHEFGISLLLDYQPMPQGAAPWPLLLGADGGIEMTQKVGDAVFYNAHEIPHSRRGPLPEGHRSASILLHFVPQEFRGPQEYSPFFA
ncbi:MAG TPA: hypothetical protein VLJ37_07535 [bacterium]|nr:hypothetical protein [bacterium]